MTDRSEPTPHDPRHLPHEIWVDPEVYAYLESVQLPGESLNATIARLLRYATEDEHADDRFGGGADDAPPPVPRREPGASPARARREP
jgi:hypothetical protein